MALSYFISDVHLGAESRQREEAKREKLVRLLTSLDSADNLFILGDFFDFWFDYGSVLFREYFDILCVLRSLSRSGVKMHFFGGNHDWWAFDGGILAREIGAKIYRRPAEILIESKRFFLAHGDGIARSDWGYRNLLAPVLRNPVSIALFRLVPPPVAWMVAKLVSSSSKLYTQKRNLRFEAEYEEFARAKIAGGVDFVIFGHLHIPILKQIDGGVYANCGDFFQNFTYIVFDGEKLHLRRFEEQV